MHAFLSYFNSNYSRNPQKNILNYMNLEAEIWYNTLRKLKSKIDDRRFNLG